MSFAPVRRANLLVGLGLGLLTCREDRADMAPWPVVDSVPAQAAGMSIERLHAVSATVESSLRERAAMADEMQRLDSLRMELMVLRVRGESER